MKTINTEVINALKSVPVKELSSVGKILDRAVRHNLSIDEALEFEKFSDGTKVKYLGRKGEYRYGSVEKVNQRRIKIRDQESEEEIFRKPSELEIQRGRIPRKASN